jgi:hypothetical protein
VKGTLFRRAFLHLRPAKSYRTTWCRDTRQKTSNSPWQPPWLLPLRHLALDPPAFCLDPRMTEPGAGSKWQGLQLVEQAERGAHPRVEPDPLLDLAELAVRLRVEPDPLQD